MSDHDDEPTRSMWALIYGLVALCGGIMGAALMWLVQRFWLQLAFIWSVSWLTVGLCASEVPDWVLRGIAAVETGVHWNDTDDIDGTWSSNSTGDVGPWHISPAVLKDLKREHLAERINREPVLAESIARLWMLELYKNTGDWRQVCAAWRLGLGRRHEAKAREYAERAFNYGTAY